jgi:choline-sulfatase
MTIHPRARASEADRPNIVVIHSDEHAAGVMGAAGHPLVETPHLDRLASQSLMFENAYCASPICVPSRLSMFSGRYAHEIDAWDNNATAAPDFVSWAHHLRDAGYESILAGRAHLAGSNRLVGFDRKLSDDLPIWLEPLSDIPSRDAQERRASNSHVSGARAGDHFNTRHDELVTEIVADFFRRRAAEPRSPFLLFTGYMHPHFPLVAPPELIARYDPAEVALPPTWHEDLDTQHPVIAQLRRAFRNDEPLPEDLARFATASYLALVTHLDAQLGRLLDALDESGLGENTLVVYTSDHGEMLGEHGIWQKNCFYEASARVPLMLRLPEQLRPAQPAGPVTTNVSHVDLLPTFRELAELPVDENLPGTSLLHATEPRAVFSEYHAQGMIDGGFMLKYAQYKYIEYVGHAPQLFDVAADPHETVDLAGSPAYANLLTELRSRLAAIVDTEAVDRRAKADQRRRREARAIG